MCCPTGAGLISRQICFWQQTYEEQENAGVEAEETGPATGFTSEWNDHQSNSKSKGVAWRTWAYLEMSLMSKKEVHSVFQAVVLFTDHRCQLFVSGWSIPFGTRPAVHLVSSAKLPMSCEAGTHQQTAWAHQTPSWQGTLSHSVSPHGFTYQLIS